MNNHKKGQIESAKVVVREVFSNFWFSIPAYQRSYVWGKDEISELIDDVNYASQHSPDGQYFLGSMVLQKDSVDEHAGGQQVTYDVHHLLDGQQRLTTLFLMTAVIRDLTGEEKLRKKCCEMLFQEENSWDNTPGRNRIVYQIRDNVGEFIKHFVKPDGGTLLADELGAYERENNLSLSNMARAIRFMRERFMGWQPEEFGRFTKYLFNNALFIYVATEDLDDAFRLFTILNDRGIPLSNSDILKARNLGEVKDPKENAKWAAFWEDIEGELGRDEFDRFLSFVRTIYVKDKAREGLLKEFDEHILPQNPAAASKWMSDFTSAERGQWLHKLGNLMMLSRRKNTSLGNLDFASKKSRYFANSVETLPNSARVLILPAFSPATVQARHDELLAKLSASY